MHIKQYAHALKKNVPKDVLMALCWTEATDGKIGNWEEIARDSFAHS